jgi:hypothetical protein
MAAPASLLRQARAFARDFPRDSMPPGYLWDVVDYVPMIIDAPLTGRGGWLWGSTTMSGDGDAGILASFPTSEKLLIVGTDLQWYEVDQASPYTATARGTARQANQNPIQYRSTVVHFDKTRANVPQLLTAPTGTLVIADMHSSAPKAPVGAVWNDYVIAGGAPGEEDTLRFSIPGDPTAAWDVNSFERTNMPITALAAMRAVVLIFHAGQTERIRGSIPPNSANTNDDLIRELLFGRTGCSDPKTIAYWNDNIVFSDEHGCHMTDGAVIRNLVSQGGILYYWRQLYALKTSIAACTFLDYYIVTVRTSDGGSTTLVCDLNKRQWFRLGNIYAISYVASAGSTGMERVWAGMAGTHRLGRIGPVFFPVLGVSLIQDDDGQAVMPSFQTGRFRLGEEAHKRIRFCYLSYDVRGLGAGARNLNPQSEEMAVPPFASPALLSTISPILEVGYITAPQDPTYTVAGALPQTSDYRRFKLPVGKQPYGIAFQVRQTQPSTVNRVFDIAVEAWATERSRL